MSPAGSVSRWIQGAKEGDHDAIRQLLERYLQRLVRLARHRLQALPHLDGYDEDVALSAFNSLVRRAQDGCFDELNDRDDLWQLFALLTVRKAISLLREEGRRPQVEDADVEQLLSQEPTPELAAQMADEFRRLLDSLGDAELRAIVLWKMEGFSNDEIAAKLGCVERTVERRLSLIRTIWEAEGSQP